MKRITLVIFLLCAYFSNAQIKEDNYTIRNIAENTKYQDFGVSFYGDKKVVFASSRRKKSIKNNIWRGNNQPFLQAYQGIIGKNGEIREVEEFSKGVNTKFHDATLTFTKDLKTVYFTSNNYLNKKFKKDTLGWNLNQLYKAEIGKNGEWTNVQAMPFNNDNYQTGHPALSTDESKLYFISDMPGGFGLTDIYVVDILNDGSFGDPINLGPNVNTEGKEMFPYVNELNYLYFSSDGYIDGRGGLDVYVTRIFDYEPKPSLNLKSPINTIADDFAFVFQEGKNTGYFSSNRSGGKGDDDIYAFTELSPLLVYCTQFVSGFVLDGVTGDPVDGALVVLYDENDKEISRMIVEGDEAEYNFEVACNKAYKVVATKPNYSTDSKEFFLEYGKDAVVPLEIKIDEFLIERGKCLIKINPIYFDFDRSRIRPDAEIELNKVVEVMKKYPELIIEAGSHTDSRGNNIYNQQLSARRAKSTVNYLIKRGIDPSRLSHKGYGETELVNGCSDGVKCSKEDHQLNRRTEFSIVNYGEIREIYASICAIETVSVKEQIEIEQQIEEIRKENVEAFKDEFETKTGNVHIKIDPIYFELNSVEVDLAGKKQLDRVVELMNKYGDIIVEAGSHTDSRSSFRVNEELSTRRATATVNYIISKGIDPRRITGRGYGETKPVNGCVDGVRCSEADHALNRRLEFIIVNPEVIKDIEEVIIKKNE